MYIVVAAYYTDNNYVQEQSTRKEDSEVDHEAHVSELSLPPVLSDMPRLEVYKRAWPYPYCIILCECTCTFTHS